LLSCIDDAVPAEIAFAHGTATIPRNGIPVVALFQSLHPPVSAAHFKPAGRRAAVASKHVPVITFLNTLGDRIAAPGIRTAVRAAISIAGIAVVTLFSGLHDAVAATFPAAVVRAAVIVCQATIIALLPAHYSPIPADRFEPTLG